MRRLSFVPLLLLALIVNACSDSTSSQRIGGPRATALQPDSGQMRFQLNQIYPAGGLNVAANSQLTNIFRSYGKGSIKTAQQQAAALCEFTQTQLEKNRLVQPSTTSVPAPTLSDLVTRLCDQTYLYVGLGPGGIDVSSQDAIAVYIDHTKDTTIYTPNHRMGLMIPAGTFNQDVTILVTPLEGTGGVGPLITSQYQVPWFYDIVSSPEVPAGTDLNHPVVVGICSDETQIPTSVDHGNLRIGHNKRTAAGPVFEQLPQAAPPPDVFSECPAAPSGLSLEEFRDSSSLTATSHLLGFLADAAIGAITPKSAYAFHGALGGTTSSFSAFGGFVASSVTGVSVSPSSATIPVGGTQTYTATATGSPVNATLWSSSNPLVATVSSAGVVTGVGFGTASIIANMDGVVGSATVNVSSVQPVSLTMLTPSAVQLTGPAGTASWSSSSVGVATVSSTGLVTAIASGPATINALDANSGVLQSWPLNTATFGNYPRYTIAAWPIPVSFSPSSYRVILDFCDGSPNPDWTLCTTWTNRSTQITKSNSYYFEFVGEQAGRWKVEYLDAAGAIMGSTGYQYFAYTL